MSLYDVNGNNIAQGIGYFKTDHKKLPPYYGFDIDNGVNGAVSTFRVDVSKLPNENLTVIAPYLGQGGFTGEVINIYGDTTVNINPTRSYLYVGETQYMLSHYDLSNKPDNITSWRFYIALPQSHGYTNETSWIVPDMALEDIDAEFISAECITESVSTEFVNAVRVANEKSGVVADISSLKGKVWLAFGDSYTRYLAGLGTDDSSKPNPTDGTATDSLQWGKLSNQLGMTLYSYGIVGSTIRYSTNNGSDGFSWQPMVTRVDNIIENHKDEADNVGLITFMGGTNDGWTAERIGTIMSQEKETIAGSCHQIFRKLLNAFPNAKIIVILQPVRGDGTNSGTDVDGNDTSGFDDMQFNILQSYKKQKAVKDVAEFYGLTICDCCFDWYTTANPNHLKLIWDSSDKLHLTAMGNQKLTEKLTKTLESVFV